MGKNTTDIGTPVWKHDCNECTFKGSKLDERGFTVDVYRCEQHGLPTWIARYGNAGPEYTTLPESMVARAQEGAHPHWDVILPFARRALGNFVDIHREESPVQSAMPEALARAAHDAMYSWQKRAEESGSKIPVDPSSEAAMIDLLHSVVLKLEATREIEPGRFGFRITGFKGEHCGACGSFSGPDGFISFSIRTRRDISDPIVVSV